MYLGISDDYWKYSDDQIQSNMACCGQETWSSLVSSSPPAQRALELIRLLKETSFMEQVPTRDLRDTVWKFDFVLWV